MNNSNLKTADDFKCPGCGAPISYDPATGGLHCEYCGYEENIKKKQAISKTILLKDKMKITIGQRKQR